ncbi:MAG: NYN domain-containing protein [Aquabacterium sp.]|uniref:NYN domain-containing protein n=1 Tax=Aquabacterium sp. TaxID=1872578 RepID=UPI00120EBB45|nr:NYN domain-containing protein [Aquabacterium sp.]TAK95163.1 MAG: NYN domain-containing protein [Aquabacterium sp.]
MAIPQDNISMALFCDFENVALGVRDANYDKFDIKRVLERLLLKGSIVVKKAYCDWERYKGFKSAMHEANFELIEIPHVRQSGKNSADIRLVVDALDLCYTKSHVNTFVIISGDSDFSPLVSKLRENAKYVIGVGVKNSTSDLLIANCDEFIFYDDLVRESQRQAARRDNRDQPQQRRTPEEDRRRREEMDLRRTKAVEMAAETYEALVTDRDEGGRVWASVLKEAIKRRNPGFNENYYGFRTFGNLLEDAQQRGLLDFGRDEKSGAYVSRGTGTAAPRIEPTAPAPSAAAPAVSNSENNKPAAFAHTADKDAAAHIADNADVDAVSATGAKAGEDADNALQPAGDEGQGARQRGRQRNGGRQSAAKNPARKTARGRDGAQPSADKQGATQPAVDAAPANAPGAAAPKAAPKVEPPTTPEAAPATAPARSPASARNRNTARKAAPAKAASNEAPEQAAPSSDDAPAARKSASRSRRPRKPAAKQAAE